MKDFLMSINRLQIWRQRVSLWGNIFVPPTLDRLAALWLHQRGMLGVREKLFLERFIQPGMIVADVGVVPSGAVHDRALGIRGFCVCTREPAGWLGLL
jgi:hypothetical protein